MPNLIWVAVSLLGVLGLMFLMFFGLRMLNRRITASGGRLRVIDRVTIGREAMIIVVSVCGKLMLVGVSAQRVEKIADIEMTEQEYTEMAFSNAGVLPFSDILSSIGIKKQKKEIEINEDGQDS
jgi:flagellar biogenesis protein FliO